MNRERARELLPIIQAFAEGKEVEVKMISIKGWLMSHDPQFDQGGEWRIKPEPKELWVMVYNNKTRPSFSSSYETEKAVTDYMQTLQKDNPVIFDDAFVIKVREVIDES